jgi:hypothetical protein
MSVPPWRPTLYPIYGTEASPRPIYDESVANAGNNRTVLGLGLLAAVGGAAYVLKKLFSEPSSAQAQKSSSPSGPKPVPIPTQEANGPLPIHPFLSRMADPKVVTGILQGKYDVLTEAERMSLLERPLTINDFAESPEAWKTLFLPGRTLSAQKQAVLQTLEDPARFVSVMNGVDNAEVRQTQMQLVQDPLIFHDLLEKPDVLSNLYGWLANRQRDASWKVTEKFMNELVALDNQLPSYLSFNHPEQPAANPDNKAFAYLEKIEHLANQVAQEIQIIEKPDYRARVQAQLRAQNTPKGGFAKRFYVDDSAQKTNELLQYEVGRRKRLLEKMIEYYPAIEKQETEYEMMHLMKVLTQIFGNRITQEFHGMQRDPESVFEALFAPQEDLRFSKHVNATQIVLFQGNRWTEFPKKVKVHYKEPPRPVAVKRTLEYSAYGAMTAGLFSGVVGLGLDTLNKFWKLATQRITGHPRVLHRKEAWVEDVVGKKLLNSILGVYQVDLNQVEVAALSEAASKVAGNAFYGKLLTSFFKSQFVGDLVQKLSGKVISPPPYNPTTHMSTLSKDNPVFKSLLQGLIDNHNNSSIVERLGTVKGYLAKLVPSSAIDWLNHSVEPVLRHAGEWGSHVIGWLHESPFADHLLKFIGNIPLKSELLTSTISYSFNMITGLGNMALLDTAKKNNNHIPQELITNLEQGGARRIMRTYIEQIWKQIDQQSLQGDPHG